jgi:hypothetical protein
LSAIAAGAAFAGEDIKPMDGVSVDLGSFHGSAYYTVRQDGIHLKVTLARMNGEKIPGEPLRFETVLPAGGSVTVSTPQAEGQQAIAMTFDRVGDRLAWHEGGREVNIVQPKASQAPALSSTAETQPAGLSGAELYRYLHDPTLHQPDGLGSYGEDFRAAYPY